MKYYQDVIMQRYTGLPVVGALVAVTRAGTDVPATLFAVDNPASASLPSNAVTTGNDGRFGFYVANGSYDLTITGPGRTTTKLLDIEIYDLDKLVAGLSNKVNLFDIIPGQLQPEIIARTSTTDVASYVQGALTALNARGGGTLEVPDGLFRLASRVTVPRKVAMVGAGRVATTFAASHDGHAFRSVAPLNASTPVNITLRSFGITCLNPGTNTGAGYFDTGGTYIEVTDVAVSGFDYGVLLDQSELADIDMCQFEYQTHSCIRFRNGPTLVSGVSNGANPGYTNRISVTRTQLNQATKWAICDDGGWAHAYRDNNYNGCGEGHIRIAGYTHATIEGGEWEYAGGPNILLSNTSHGGKNNDVGRPENVLIQGTAIAADTRYNAVKVEAVTSLTMLANFLDGGATPSVGGLDNCQHFFKAGGNVRNPAGFSDGTKAYGTHTVL